MLLDQYIYFLCAHENMKCENTKCVNMIWWALWECSFIWSLHLNLCYHQIGMNSNLDLILLTTLCNVRNFTHKNREQHLSSGFCHICVKQWRGVALWAVAPLPPSFDGVELIQVLRPSLWRWTIISHYISAFLVSTSNQWDLKCTKKEDPRKILSAILLY